MFAGTEPRKDARLIGLLLVVAVFILPFHSHVNFGDSQIRAECACIHRSRSDPGTTVPVVSPTPLFVAFPLVFFEQVVNSRQTLCCRSIRAPPPF